MWPHKERYGIVKVKNFIIKGIRKEAFSSYMRSLFFFFFHGWIFTRNAACTEAKKMQYNNYPKDTFPWLPCIRLNNFFLKCSKNILENNCLYNANVIFFFFSRKTLYQGIKFSHNEIKGQCISYFEQ